MGIKFKHLAWPSGEEIIQGFDDDFNAYVCIHNTNRGPALGGTRYRDFGTEQVQLFENMELAESMSYKNALADIPYGGGKATVMETDNPDKWKLYAELLNYVNAGNNVRYIAAGDVGTGPDVLQEIAKHTNYVATGNPKEDSGFATAYGVYMSILAAAGFAGIARVNLGIEGMGKVGERLAHFTKNAQQFSSVIAQDPFKEEMLYASNGLSLIHI